MVDFFAKPMSFEISNGQLLTDFNRDGLSDSEALNFGITPYDNPTSGITDYIALEYLGIAPKGLGQIPQCQNTTQSTSGDLLTDCQKTALGLTPVFEYDPVKRGFPDSLAVYARLPLFDKTIASKDIAGDGVNTLAKIKMNLRPDQFITSDAEALAVVYDIETVVNPKTPNSPCYTLTITSPRAVLDNGDLYEFYFISLDNTGKSSLTTKAIVVPPSVADGASLEYEYEKL
jgi:hypothetical protein